MIADLVVLLDRRGPCCCDELAAALRRRRFDVLATLRAHPDLFQHNGYGGRYSRWAVHGHGTDWKPLGGVGRG
jgi:hypothetical protein